MPRSHHFSPRLLSVPPLHTHLRPQQGISRQGLTTKGHGLPSSFNSTRPNAVKSVPQHIYTIDPSLYVYLHIIYIYIYYYLSDYLYVIAHVWCLGRRIYHVSVNIMYIYILLYTYALHRLKYGRGPSIFQKKLVFSDVRTKVPPFRGICMAS